MADGNHGGTDGPGLKNGAALDFLGAFKSNETLDLQLNQIDFFLHFLLLEFGISAHRTDVVYS